MVEIPLRSDLPHFTVVVELDGNNYRLEFRWNTRDQSWYMHQYDADEVLIQGSLKCVIGWPIGVLTCADPRKPPGFLIFEDTSNNKQTDPTWTEGKDLFTYDQITKVPGYGDLGDRVRLYYVELADILA